jgi:uncharacterized peroxidase-related enzyme
MPYIPVEEHLPGITGLLEYSRETAKPIRELTQLLLRGPSTLTEGERELIALVVSHRNECKFCSAAHQAVADLLLGECNTTERIKESIDSALLSEKIRALLEIAAQVQSGGKNVTRETVEKAKSAGATDSEIHDTVLIAALFSLYNRYVDGLATVIPGDSGYYKKLAERIAKGYHRQPEAYEQLKQQHKAPH